MNRPSRQVAGERILSSEAKRDLVVLGGGAAGLMTAIWAGRSFPGKRVVVLDGAEKLGAKILVAGGGRCNVTHHRVTAADYAGSSRNAIKKVLARFPVDETVKFFRALGVELKQEDTGKLFPTTDSARTILDALLRAASQAGVEIRTSRRVDTVEPSDDGFVIRGGWGELETARVVLATGGKSLPKTGSDGGGYAIAKALGHTITDRVFPALVPLRLADNGWVQELSGIAVDAALTVHGPTGKRLVSFTNSTLCTHFGLSGPAVLDISRYLIDARLDDPKAYLSISWLGGTTGESYEADLQSMGDRTVLGDLKRRLPQRLAEALAAEAGVDGKINGHHLTTADRRRLVEAATNHRLAVVGDRGFKFAEVTAGGIPLPEIQLKTMASRVCPGLGLCGEICDVDGRIGGFNFQWAWASGFIAGTSAFAGDS